MAAARTQLAANTFSLGSVLINLANPAAIVTEYSRSLLKWLSREGIDEDIFSRCMELARGLAYPNSNGFKIRDSMEKADARLLTINNCPLPLKLSGSLGRILIREPDLCYMVSTTASLVIHHDLNYAKSALCSMILDQGRS